MFIHELEKKYEINLDNVEDRKFENIMVFYISIYILFLGCLFVGLFVTDKRQNG